MVRSQVSAKRILLSNNVALPLIAHLYVVRSLNGKAPHCECGQCGFKSRRSTQICQFQIRNFKFEIVSGSWQKGVCTSLSRKTMTVRVRSVPPFGFWILDCRFSISIQNPQSKIRNQIGRLAETDQRRPEEPKSLVRYQKRPPICQNGLRPQAANS